MTLLSVPLNFHVLKALEAEPCALIDLRRAVGSPPQTTMRVYLKGLSEMGVVERRRQNDFPGIVEYGLTRPGAKLLEVADVLQHWLRAADHGPISLGSPGARSAVKALVEGWQTNIVRALAARPVTLTELARFIPSVSYPTLERRLAAMRHSGQVEAHRGNNGNGRGTPYKATQWLRCSVAPLTAAVGWEYRYVPELAGPVNRMDVESTFLLSVPLLELSPEVSGRCRLTTELRKGRESEFAGVTVTVREGKVTSCVSRLEGDVDAWVSGNPLGWFRWVNRHEDDGVEIGGDYDLAHGLAEGIRGALVETERL